MPPIERTPLSLLPLQLRDGLVLRWAEPEDTEPLAAFNARIHSPEEEPNEGIAAWTRDLMSGRHPTVGPGDFTVVIDPDGAIVSSVVLVSQTWSYAGIPFGVGRPELVGTLPDYRRQGLVRRQMHAIHALSALRGELVQAITGIPWYYRLFGYEQTVNLGGQRVLSWELRGSLAGPDFRARRAGEPDITLLRELYAVHTAPSLLRCERDEAIWRYNLVDFNPEAVNYREYWIAETESGEPVGYWAMYHWRHLMGVNEIAAAPGRSLRDLALFVARTTKARADGYNAEAEKPVRGLSWHLDTDHPAYDALGRLLERPNQPYAWYLRVPDLPAFLRHIGPVLEARLADSVLAGFTGKLKLSFYRSQFQLEFDAGRLSAVGPYEPAGYFDADAFFPDETFLHVLFGHRTPDEIHHVRPDCFVEQNGSQELIAVLFPRHLSHIDPLV